MVVAHANYLASLGHDVRIRVANVCTIFNINESVGILSFLRRGKLGTILSCFLNREECDIVVADIIPLACVLFLANGRKVRYYAQDYDESYYSRWWQRAFIRLFYYIGLSLFRIPTIAVSERLGALLKQRFRADVEIVENGVETSVFYRRPNAALLHDKEKTAVLVLARDDARKGFDLAQTVTASIAQERNDFEVWTVGISCPGAFPEVLHRDLGYVGEHRLAEILSSADIFFFPTRHEGFPLMVLEAFACGCSVVTTEAVCCARDGVNAFVASVEDVVAMKRNLAKLLDERLLRERLAAAGQEEAARRSLAATLTSFAAAVTGSL